MVMNLSLKAELVGFHTYVMHSLRHRDTVRSATVFCHFNMLTKLWAEILQ